LAGYLLDLRQWKQAIDQIKVSWDASPQQSFIHKLRISSSQDLSRWNTVANGMTLVSLSYQGQQLVEDTIKLSASPVSYLRIMFDDDKPGLELNDIQVQSIKSSRNEELKWHQAKVTETQVQGEYAFENPFKAMSEMHRVLKKGGILLIDAPFNYRWFGEGSFPGAKPKKTRVYDYWRITRDGWELLTKDFKDVRVERSGPNKWDPYTYMVKCVK